MDREHSSATRARKGELEMANPAPVIGDWYRQPGGETFEVVAIDPDDRTIEIQYFDGTVEELELEDWLDDQIAVTEAPEDWTGSVDVEPEDYENEVENAAERRRRRGPIRCSSSIAVRSAAIPRSSCPNTPDELGRC